MERPGVGLGVILMKDNKVLLGKRKGSHGAETWAFPRGHLELYESFEDCALREIKEETGLNVNLIDHNPIAVTNDFFRKEDKHYATLYLRAEYLGGIPKVMEEDRCEKWDWFFWNSFPEPLFPGIDNLLKQGYNPFQNNQNG